MNCTIAETMEMLNKFQGFFALISLFIQIGIFVWIGKVIRRRRAVELELALFYSIKNPLEKQVVVTETVKKLVWKGKLEFRATWAKLYGNDFAIGEKKKLRLRFIVKNQIITKEFDEDSLVKLRLSDLKKEITKEE